jgi:CubicO group peptidase (beta-lactamase class C family)
LSNFFPKIPKSKDIKILNLLNHSSGLFNITSAPDALEWIFKPSDQKMMLSRIVSYDLNFDPGEQSAYSNTNYILLGYIIENLDKRSYKESLNERISSRIGLKNTYYGGKINTKEHESYSYVYEDGNWIKGPETNMSNPGGAGAIVSTAGDLTSFMSALFNGKLMSSSSFEIMKSTNDNETCHGLFYANMDGLDLYASEGGIDGFQSLLVHLPKTQTTIALTANGLDFSKMRIIMSALAASQGKPITLPNFRTIELTEAQAKQYEGEYACDNVPFNLTFKAEGNSLMGAAGESEPKLLTPTKQHQFTFNALGVILDFYPENGMLKFTEGNNEPLIFNKLN